MIYYLFDAVKLYFFPSYYIYEKLVSTESITYITLLGYKFISGRIYKKLEYQENAIKKFKEDVSNNMNE